MGLHDGRRYSPSARKVVQADGGNGRDAKFGYEQLDLEMAASKVTRPRSLA